MLLDPDEALSVHRVARLWDRDSACLWTLRPLERSRRNRERCRPWIASKVSAGTCDSARTNTSRPERARCDHATRTAYPAKHGFLFSSGRSFSATSAV